MYSTLELTLTTFFRLGARGCPVSCGTPLVIAMIVGAGSSRIYKIVVIDKVLHERTEHPGRKQRITDESG